MCLGVPGAVGRGQSLAWLLLGGSLSPFLPPPGISLLANAGVREGTRSRTLGGGGLWGVGAGQVGAVHPQQWGTAVPRLTRLTPPSWGGGGSRSPGGPALPSPSRDPSPRPCAGRAGAGIPRVRGWAPLSPAALAPRPGTCPASPRPGQQPRG